MDNTITTAIITGLCVAVPSVLATMMSNNSSKKLLEFRIEQLDKKVEKHNNVIERMAVAENSIKSAHHRIDDLEDK